jgi:predicted phosphodiesterase
VIERVAALYDIHGNLPALQTVLPEVQDAKVELIVAGGDVFLGPMPVETVDCLLNCGIPVEFILGNCEIAVLEQIAGREPARIPEQYRPSIGWVARQLGAPGSAMVSRWPKTLRVEVRETGSLLFCHATPRNEDECFTRLTPEDRLRPIFDSCGSDFVVCGHTHMQFDRTVGSTRVVNAGSVGMPFGEPGADWALLGPGVQLRHTLYDLEEAAQRIRATDYPDAGQFAANHVLKPPTEQQMLQVFSKAELQ